MNCSNGFPSLDDHELVLSIVSCLIFFSRQIVDGMTELLMVQLNYFGSLFLFFYVTSSTTH